MYRLHLEKAEEPEIKLPTFVGSSKKPENSRRDKEEVARIHRRTVPKKS